MPVTCLASINDSKSATVIKIFLPFYQWTGVWSIFPQQWHVWEKPSLVTQERMWLLVELVYWTHSRVQRDGKMNLLLTSITKMALSNEWHAQGGAENDAILTNRMFPDVSQLEKLQSMKFLPPPENAHTPMAPNTSLSVLQRVRHRLSPQEA